jgi:hypothetical protein
MDKQTMTNRNPNLNRDNIDKVIARIRKNKEFVFNMGSWGRPTINKDGQFIDDNGDVTTEHPCGTAACIAGFCVVVKHNDMIPWDRHTGVEGREFLGLEEDQANRLFLPEFDNEGRYFGGVESNYRPMNSTADEAIRVLEHLKTTGEVDWRVAVDDYKNTGKIYQYRALKDSYLSA